MTVTRWRRNDSGFSLTELLVVIMLLGVVGATTTSVIVATTRSNNFGEALRTVMDDGRVSLDRIRNELRGGRRVLDVGSAGVDQEPFHLYWWNDRDRDGQQDTDERIHFCAAPLSSNSGTDCFTADPGPGQYQLLRWTDADGPSGAVPIARTLIDAEVFSGFDTTDITHTRTVNVTLRLHVEREKDAPDDFETSTTVRLRNVP